MSTLILASSSAYRAELLSKLDIPFEQHRPDIDESPRPGEKPDDLVVRLAREKAEAVAKRFGDAWVIGSDQIACLELDILGKPGNHENAVSQLSRFSDRELTFKTSLCLMNATTHWMQWNLVETRVKFRELSQDEIEQYLRKEQPYDCAGSFKSEGLGISLFESVESKDPTALIGLPLISLSHMLRAAGLL